MQPANQTSNNPTESFFAQPYCYLSRDGEYLTMVLPSNVIVRKHVNYFKQILGVVYTPKQKSEQVK